MTVQVILTKAKVQPESDTNQSLVLHCSTLQKERGSEREELLVQSETAAALTNKEGRRTRESEKVDNDKSKCLYQLQHLRDFGAV